MRVVSLLPSATEHLFFAGAGSALVGRSHECDFPPGIEHIPALTAARTTPSDTPAQIDQAVRDQLAGGNSLYTLDTALLARLKPDLILTQDLCGVCSIDLATVRRVAAAMDPQPRILSLNPSTVEDVLDDALRVGEAVGRAKEAAAGVVRLRERFYRASDYVNAFVDGPIAALLEWTDPLFIGGHWTPQLIERAGARHPLSPTFPIPGSGAAAGPQAASRRAGKSIRIPDEALIASRPEALIICPCGVGLPATLEMTRVLAAKPWWPDLPAVRQGRVSVVDGNHMFNRPGPRLVDAFEWLVGWINDRPDLISPGFPWSQWP